jgi:hypothetical protein
VKIYLVVLLFLIFVFPAKVNADIALLVHEAIGYSGEMTGAGHVTVYLSNVCTDAPLVLRRCRNNEPKGVVIATYPTFSENGDYKWFAMPVIPYLYGVDTAREIPLYGNGEIRTLLRETNRVKYLSNVAPASENGASPAGRWGNVIGATLNRDVYAFTVKTTAEQDARFLENYSTSPKGNDFHAVFKNCAEFTRGVMNFYFPKSASRDLINDFGITTPKALARSFKKYAAERPDLLFHITKYPQVDGTIMRSFGIRNFTETAFTSKKYIITQALTMPKLLPIFAGMYYLTGYFNTDSAHRNYPSAEMAQLNLENKLAKQKGTPSRKQALDDIKARWKTEQLRVFGEKKDWEQYRQAFSPMLEKAIKDRLFAHLGEVKSFFGDLEHQSQPFYDADGELMLRVNNYGEERLLGLTRGNILAAESDVRLAYKLMLAKIKYQLAAAARNRQSVEAFRADWQLLTELSDRTARLPDVRLPINARFQTMPNDKTMKAKSLELFRKITH